MRKELPLFMVKCVFLKQGAVISVIEAENIAQKSRKLNGEDEDSNKNPENSRRFEDLQEKKHIINEFRQWPEIVLA